MKTDMQAYGVTELTREEACATSGGWLFLTAIVSGIVSLGLAVAYAVMYFKHR